ncbi:hypothetical protein [Flavobacterium sp. 3HN19-14]|uniref:hypothetical protein n=1 Tax=Flavobacterium sp. 3HN19-14 TaxID=3448133 RepID=UPI003EE0FCFF
MSTETKKKICFVISPIGQEGSETRERSNQVLKHIITKPVEELGYTVIRADKISEPGIITTQIIGHIVDAELVIADLTDKNPNVFYELAIRHAIRKPLVQLIRKDDDIPFDVAATRIIQFDLQNLDNVENVKEEIKSQVQSIESGSSEVHNPISVSLDLKVLKESGNIEERSLADIVEAISDLRLAMTSVDKGLPSNKLLEEFKNMMDNLPSRIESRFDLDYKRRKRRFHPFMLEEMIHMEIGSNDPNLSFLMMISFFKDDYPWLYEIGLETYKDLKTAKTKEKKVNLIQDFEKVLDVANHPMFREMYGKSEDSYMLIKEARHSIIHFLDRFLMKE